MAISEQFVQLERDWIHLKQKLSTDLERLDINLNKVSEFDKLICQMRDWTVKQLTVTNSSANGMQDICSIESDKKVMAYDEQLKQIKSELRNPQDDSFISRIAKLNVDDRLNELESNMDKIKFSLVVELR